MITKYYPHCGGNFDRIVFDGDGSVWVPDAKLREVESENASLRGAAQGLGELCDRYKSENERLRACLGDGCADCALGMGEYADSLCDPLKVENAKLRELAKSAWGCVNRHVSCYACRMTCGGCTLQSAMRELGIEVS